MTLSPTTPTERRHLFLRILILFSLALSGLNLYQEHVRREKIEQIATGIEQLTRRNEQLKGCQVSLNRANTALEAWIRVLQTTHNPQVLHTSCLGMRTAANAYNQQCSQLVGTMTPPACP